MYATVQYALIFDRTKEQLGYIVHAHIRRGGGIQGLQVVVQSGKHPTYVNHRIEAFLSTVKVSYADDHGRLWSSLSAPLPSHASQFEHLNSQWNVYLMVHASQVLKLSCVWPHWRLLATTAYNTLMTMEQLWILPSWGNSAVRVVLY